MTKTVYLYGYYGFNNLGDQIIFSAIYKFFLKNNAKIIFCRSFKHFKSTPKVYFVTKAEKMFLSSKISKLKKLYFFIKQNWKVLKKSNVLFIGGGSLLHAINNSLSNLFYLWLLSFLAKLCGNTILVCGVSADHIDSFIGNCFLKQIITKCDLLCLRDKSSFNKVVKYTSKNVFLTEDFVHLFYTKTPKNRILKNQKHIGLSLTSPNLNNLQYKNEMWMYELHKLISYFLKINFKITFFSMQEFNYKYIHISDKLFFSMIGLNKESLSKIFFKTPKSINEFYNEARSISIFLGTRFHSLVCTAHLNIPFIGFGDNKKILEICSTYKMPYFSYKKFKKDKVIAAIKRIRKQVSLEKTNILRNEMSQRNVTLIKPHLC